MNAEVEKLVNLLNEQGKMVFKSPVLSQEIEEFEINNAIKFPKEFCNWLKFSDGGEFFLPAGVQIYGIKNPPLIDINNENRPNDNYIVIGALSSGDPILCKKESAEISIYNQEAGRIEDDEVYSNFYDFLNNMYDFLGIGE